MSYYYSQTKKFGGGEPEHYHIWLFNETAGNTAVDTGTGGGSSGLDNGSYENSPTQVTDGGKDVLQFTLSSNDRVNFGDVEGVVGLAKMTHSICLKPLSTSGSLQIVYNADASGSNSGDMSLQILSSGTIARFTIQTTGPETKTIDTTIVFNAYNFIVVTWDSVAKEIKIYTTDFSTPDATNTYTGTSVPLIGSVNYNHGANAGSSNAGASNQGRTTISPVIATAAELQAIADTTAC